MATFPLLTTLNESYSDCYEYHTTILGETGDDSRISQAPPVDRYHEQMAEVARLAREYGVATMARRAGVSQATLRHALAGGRSQLLTKLKLSVAVAPKKRRARVSRQWQSLEAREAS